jgi:hypothetical protein
MIQLRTIASVADRLVHCRDRAELRAEGARIKNEVQPDDETRTLLAVLHEARKAELPEE